ncbi:MAG TPA: alginate export family protein, partial [Vicinamibacterales bacterium]|nr:alginate export family protein [Vicinamibacterales bacterium]
MERRQLGRGQSIIKGLALAIVLVLSASAFAQPAEPKVTGTISNVTRVESWSYFEPRMDILALSADPIGNPDYTFIGDRAELGVRVEGDRFDIAGAFNYVRLENLPTKAIGPGGFGTGAFYFAATGVRYSYQLYLGELTIRVKSRDRSRVLTFGRLAFPESRHVLARDRVDGRLLGNFEWSLYQRRFDGARVDMDRGRWHVTAGAFMPTQGGFEESTNLTMTKIQLGTATATYSTQSSESQAFAYSYRDRRRGRKAVVDNRLGDDAAVDVTVATVGGSHARVIDVPTGETDIVAWGAAQLGDWYGLPHRAGSAVVEAGHRWPRAAGRPWVRAGYAWASGDGVWDDGRHTT